ncbi:type II toxin-antitoxin system PemK/MazF family toxin [Pseudoxanthomonas wuyuanensis]
MAILYAPRVGAVLLCEFPSSFVAPEMVKTRPVVVVTPKMKGRANLVGVVPLSTTPPNPICVFHCKVAIGSMPRSIQAEATEVWAKCDMVYTFALHRLDRFKAGREHATGKRLYDAGQLSGDEVDAVRRCMASAFGIRAGLLE